MTEANYRIDWSRPVPASLPGERAYHATDGVKHILVIATEAQILTAERLADDARESDPEMSIQQVVEDAINRALEARPLTGGELRLEDGDFL